MTETSTACKNCGSTLTGKFCQACGQKADIHKITIKHLLHEFFHALTHADKGFLYLIKELTYRPGYVALEYIAGKRKKYFNPLSFLVIISAVFAIVAYKSGYFKAMYYDDDSASLGNMPRWMAVEVMDIVDKQGKIINLLVIVPVTTFLTWIFFRKGKHNFAENLVLQSLIIGQSNLLLILIFIPVYLIIGYNPLNNILYQITFVIYITVAYRQFFKNHIIATFLKALVIQLLFIVMYWILVVGFVIVRHQFF